MDHSENDREAEWRWGETSSFRESKRRTEGYSDEEWKTCKAQGDAIAAEIAKCMQRGASSSSAEVMALAEKHRLHIDKWFYPVDHWMHARLAELYVSDPRFRATYEEIAEGLATFLSDAIENNALANAGVVDRNSAPDEVKQAMGLLAQPVEEHESAVSEVRTAEDQELAVELAQKE